MIFSKMSPLVFVLFLFSYVSSQYPSGYITLNDFPQFPGAYKSHTRNRWYSYAVARCYVEGGILFTPTSMEELHAVFTNIAVNSKDIWIRSPFTPLRDQCAKMSSDGNMNFTSCYTGNYVCRNIVTLNITDAECERKKYISKGYSSSTDENILYKFYAIPASLYEPAITCMADDAEMFMPENQEEARVVFQLIPQSVNKIWVGATKYFTPSFTTLQGKPFVTSNWAQGQPNNQFDYVAMNRDLTYETSEYDVNKPFVCRKKIVGGEDAVFSKSSSGYKALSGYSNFKGTYKTFGERRWFSYAVARCYVDGAMLFTPNSIEELDTVFAQVATHTNDIWIKSPFTPKRNQCAKMSSKGHLYFTNCHDGHYVCRNIVNQNVTDIECEKRKYISKGYTFFPDQNSLYKFYDTPVILFEPAVICMSDDAEMFVPQNVQEAIEIWEMIPRNINRIWIGATKYFTSTFTTLQGKPFITTDWATGHPNNQFDYVAMNRDLTYQTSDYDVDKRFVCKKKLGDEDTWKRDNAYTSNF